MPSRRTAVVNGPMYPKTVRDCYQNHGIDINIEVLVSFTTPRGISGQVPTTASSRTVEDQISTKIPMTTDESISRPIPESSVSMTVACRTPNPEKLTERHAFLFMTYVHKLAPLVSLSTQDIPHIPC